MHPPSSFYLSHTYNVSVHTGQTDGWKSKLLIATMGNVRVCAEKKKVEPFLPTPASLWHFKPEHPLWSPYPGLSRYHYGTYGLQNSGFLLKTDDKHAYFFHAGDYSFCLHAKKAHEVVEKCVVYFIGVLFWFKNPSFFTLSQITRTHR